MSDNDLRDLGKIYVIFLCVRCVVIYILVAVVYSAPEPGGKMKITDSMATEPCPYTDGQLLKVVRGGFAGKVLRVNGRDCFWAPEWWRDGDRESGQYFPAGWEIVLDIEHDGEWLYFVRENASEVARLTEPVEK